MWLGLNSRQCNSSLVFNDYLVLISPRQRKRKNKREPRAQKSGENCLFLCNNHQRCKSSGPIFFFFGLFRATPTAYESSQARGRIGTAASGLHHRHSDTGSKPTYITAHDKTGFPTHWGKPGIKPMFSWILVKFITTDPPWELPSGLIFNLHGSWSTEQLTYPSLTPEVLFPYIFGRLCLLILLPPHYHCSWHL